MARDDSSRSINAMLGLTSKPYDPTARGLVARGERAMNRPAGELSDEELVTLLGQGSSEASALRTPTIVR